MKMGSITNSWKIRQNQILVERGEKCDSFEHSAFSFFFHIFLAVTKIISLHFVLAHKQASNKMPRIHWDTIYLLLPERHSLAHKAIIQTEQSSLQPREKEHIHQTVSNTHIHTQTYRRPFPLKRERWSLVVEHRGLCRLELWIFPERPLFQTLLTDLLKPVHFLRNFFRISLPQNFFSFSLPSALFLYSMMILSVTLASLAAAQVRIVVGFAIRFPPTSSSSFSHAAILLLMLRGGELKNWT